MARRRSVEDQDTILELTGKIQELQNEITCMNDSRDFQDAESVRSGHSHVTNRPVSFPTSSISWRNAKPFFWNAEPQRRAAKHLGHAWNIGKRFCRSSCVFFSTLSAGIESMEFSNIRTNSLITCGEEWEPYASSGSEMPVWTVSQKIQSFFSERRLFQELWGRPTTTADFGSPFWQVPYTSNLCLLEDKVQDRGMYLFTISYGSDAMDQGSGAGWFSGWILDLRHLLVVFQCRILKYLMRGLLRHWIKSFIILTSKEESVWRNKRPKNRTVSFVEDRSLNLSTNTFRSQEPTTLSKTMPTYSLSVYEMTIFWNSILSGTEFYFLWRKSHLMTSWKDCTN